VKLWLRPWVIVLVLALAYVGLTLARYEGDPLIFALVGTQYSGRGYAQSDPQGTQGYDGQFAYYIARDPAGGWRYCDVPAYRYQRILYPLLAWALALGQPGVVPWTLVALNVAALVGGTYFTERLLETRGVSRWYALVYGLYGGLVAGLRLDLTEPLAYGLVQAGLWAWEERRDRRQEAGEAGGRRARIRQGATWWLLFIVYCPIVHRPGGAGKGDGAGRCGRIAPLPGAGAPLARGARAGIGGRATFCCLAGCAVGLAGQARRGGWRRDGDPL